MPRGVSDLQFKLVSLKIPYDCQESKHSSCLFISIPKFDYLLNIYFNHSS